MRLWGYNSVGLSGRLVQLAVTVVSVVLQQTGVWSALRSAEQDQIHRFPGN